ncbi:hypothetical protein COOONC_16736 [Cooperia oncophora]
MLLFYTSIPYLALPILHIAASTFAEKHMTQFEKTTTWDPLRTIIRGSQRDGKDASQESSGNSETFHQQLLQSFVTERWWEQGSLRIEAAQMC